MTADRIRIDYALAMSEGVGAGGAPSAEVLAAEQDAFAAALKRVMAAVDGGVLGFWKLPDDLAQADDSERLAQKLGQDIDDVLVLGIGGSSLGARAALTALSPALASVGLGSGPRVHLPDNSDPWLFKALLEKLTPKRTLVLVVSKSGGTVETAAQMLCAEQWLEQSLGKSALPRHIVAITDPEKGTLRAHARELGLPTLAIPSNVGGRFSVLTPAGLLPLYLSGIDARGLLRGAKAMAIRCENPKLLENPAGIIASLHTLHMRLYQRNIHVLMAYADALRPTAAWFVQLWAESLGKRIDRKGRVVELGPTPLPAVGATDQHAQVQLFIEGPRDKLVTFIAVDRPATDLTIPSVPGDNAYLGGHSLAELLDAERRGTALALARNGRPSLSVHLPRLDAEQLGGLFFLFEAATAFAGELLDIDAFDQPGVEEGKRLAFGLLGRPGYEAQREAVLESEKQRPARYQV
ncbi:MAG: glucose-6-phosphate isomerase [Myxococcales bacterium]